jgi:hypothetical protein
MNDKDLADKIAVVIGNVLGFITAWTFIILTLSAALMLAWNMAMPDLFGLPRASYRNGLGLALLIECVRGLSQTKVEMQ